MTTNTGGPAFPCDLTAYDPEVQREIQGMTLRDYFAAKAMQGLMGRAWGNLPPGELFVIWSTSAYSMADAMLKARKA